MRIAIAALASILSVADQALAHEMFVRPAESAIGGAATEFSLSDGSFDAPERAIDPARISRTDVSGSAAAVEWRKDGRATRARISLPANGTQAVGVRLSPKTIEHTADAFDDYLRREDLGDMLAARRGAPRTAVRERFYKQSRTIVQVGRVRSDAYARDGGERVRFLLDRHPSTLRVGRSVGFRLLRQGRPLSGQLVWTGHAGEPRPGAGREHPERAEVRTDAGGRARIRIDRPGTWYLSLIAMRPSPDPGATYETDYATLSFAVP